MNELSKSELSELTSCELTIETTQGAFVACGMALDKIREDRLYRMTHDTFEDYCQKRWGWSRQRGYQLIEAAKIVNNLPEIEQKEVKTEYQARVLKKVKSEPKMSTDLPKNGLQIESAKKTINLDKTGYPIPDAILDEWNRAETTGKDLLSRASFLKCSIENAFEEKDVIFRGISQSTISYSINLWSNLKELIPHAVCTSCSGHNPKKCTLCGGRGFIGAFIYKTAIPEELKAIRSKAVAK